MKKITFIAVAFLLLLASCAKNKDLQINGQLQTIEPYGWANYQEVRNDSIIYRVSVGNVVWSVLLSETIVVPIYLTGWELYKPVGVKAQYR